MFCSVGRVLGGNASHQGVGWMEKHGRKVKVQKERADTEKGDTGYVRQNCVTGLTSGHGNTEPTVKKQPLDA